MAEQVIWERTIDHARIAQRRQRFKRWFVLPAAAIVVIVLVAAGPANAFGAMIVLGLLCGIIGSWVHVSSLSDQANPTMVLRDGSIVMGSRSVRVDDVKKYTTALISKQTSVLGKRSRISIAKAVFRLDDPTNAKRSAPQIVEFGWPNMGEAGIATVEDALDAVLPGRWVPPADLIAAHELPPPRRPSQRHRDIS